MRHSTIIDPHVGGALCEHYLILITLLGDTQTDYNWPYMHNSVHKKPAYLDGLLQVLAVVIARGKWVPSVQQHQ